MYIRYKLKQYEISLPSPKLCLLYNTDYQLDEYIHIDYILYIECKLKLYIFHYHYQQRHICYQISITN